MNVPLVQFILWSIAMIAGIVGAYMHNGYVTSLAITVMFLVTVWVVVEGL